MVMPAALIACNVQTQQYLNILNNTTLTFVDWLSQDNRLSFPEMIKFKNS